MNKLIASLFATALAGSTSAFAGVAAPAPTAKDIAVVVDEVNYVETAQKGIVLSGYVDAGYSYNFGGGSTIVGTKFGTPDGRAGDNVPRGDFNLNALKLALEKPLSDENKLQAGFRADIMIGEDAGILGGDPNNFGAGTDAGDSDSVFLEQAYAQFRLPFGNGIDIKVGKFVTTLGYEVIERPANLNITYGNLFQNAIPLWHTGVLSSYKVNDVVDLKLGIVNASNTDNAIGFNADDNASVLAGINITAPGGNANISQNVIYSINGDSSPSTSEGLTLGTSDDAALFVYDVWGNWTPKFANDKLLLAFNIDFGAYDTNPLAINGAGSETFWGAALYAKYQFTDIFSLAGRADYLHGTDGGTKFGPATGGNVDLWSYTLTAGFDIIENLTLRAEYRVDYANDLVGVGADGPAHMAVAEVVYSF